MKKEVIKNIITDLESLVKNLKELPYLCHSYLITDKVLN